VRAYSRRESAFWHVGSPDRLISALSQEARLAAMR
jgi:hypothetical protein